MLDLPWSHSTKDNLDLKKAEELLNEQGIRIESHNQPVGEIAKKNNMNPKKLFEIIPITFPET